MPPPTDAPAIISRRRFLHAAAASVLTAVAAVASAPTADPDFRALDAKIRAGMARYGIPGVAVGVLTQSREYVRGYGVTNVDYPVAVVDALVELRGDGRGPHDSPVEGGSTLDGRGGEREGLRWVPAGSCERPCVDACVASVLTRFTAIGDHDEEVDRTPSRRDGNSEWPRRGLGERKG